MELLIIYVVSLTAALLNSAHVILQWMANKPGETFTGIAHSFADYFLYVGAIAQGATGRWIWAEHLFTNEPMRPTWYYWFYVTLGHIGSWVRLSPFATYNVSLFILVFLLCLVWYRLAKLLYPTNIFLRLTTWLFILTMTNFASFGKATGLYPERVAKLGFLNFSNVELLGQFWFSPSPVFSRLGGVPYHAAQIIMFILLAILFSRLIAPKSVSLNNTSSRGNTFAWYHFKKYYHLLLLVIGNCQPKADRPMAEKLVILGALALLAGSANPIQMLLLGASAGVTTLIFYRRNFLPLGILLLSGGLGAWMTNQEFARQAVFIAARGWELAQYAPNTLHNMLLSVGPVLLFIPFGIRSVLNRHDPLRTLLLIWGVGSFLVFLSPVPRLMGLSPVRFLHPVPSAAALGILGAGGFAQLSNLLHRKLKKLITINTIRVILITLYLLLTIPAISKQYIDRITPARNPQLLMDSMYNHVPAPITEALTRLKVTGLNPVSGAQVVLVDPAIPIEVLVPVFTGLPSFSGHPIHTLYPDVKEAKRQEFFGGNMDSEDARQFLNDHRIGFIITTPSRRLPMEHRKVFANAIIAIYEPALPARQVYE